MRFDVLICKSGKDKYFIMHNLSHGAPRRGAVTPENMWRTAGSGVTNLKVIR